MFARLFRYRKTQPNAQPARHHGVAATTSTDADYDRRAQAAIEAEIASFLPGKRTTVQFNMLFASLQPNKSATLAPEADKQEYNQLMLKHRDQVITATYKK